MATSQQFLVCSNSNATNYVSWASAVSNWLRTCGWTNSADTGQLNGAGANNWAGVSTVPGSGAFYYEIFEPGDGLTNFFLKLEYGNYTGQTNAPTLAITIGTGTDGAGNITGNLTTRTIVCASSAGSPSATLTYECNFSGTSGQFAVMLWRNGSNIPQNLAVQRSLNASGTATGSYVTVWGVGLNNTGNATGFQQSLHFTRGAAPYMASGNGGNGWCGFGMGSAQSLAFAGNVPIWYPLPLIGYFDYPPTVVGVASGSDVSEGGLFTVVNQYGQTKTYMSTKSYPFSHCAGPSSTVALCMEFD